MQEDPIFSYKIYTETFSRIALCIESYDSQKKSDTKIFKIHVKKWFTFAKQKKIKFVS
jgi:hypothetical protein